MDSLIARSEYAALDSCVYLNQAALGLIPTRCLSAMLRFMSEVAQYGNLRLSDEEELRVLDELRVAAASLLGTAPASVAITGGASEALGQAAALVGTVDASVVLVSSDFPSVSYPWLLSAQRSRTRIVTVDDRRGEDLTAGLVDAIDESTTAVCFSAVQYGTGTEVDVRAVADRAHAAGARVIVDATQIAGAAPVDMAGWDADAVVCSGYKWLSSHGGAALFALDAELVDETPQLVGWKGTEHPFAFDAMSLSLAPDARRFEMSTIAYASAVGLCESITMLSDLDLRRIQAHARRLAASLVERVAPLGWSPFRDLSDPASSGHIVALTHPTLSSGTAQRFLAAEHRVICSDRNGCLRVSLHAYNDDSDIEALVHGLAEVGATARARIIQRPTARHTQTPEAPANNVFDPSLCHRPTLRYQQDYVPNRPGRPTVTLMATHGADQHHHGHVHLDEADWEALAAHTELEGELLLAFVTDSARWIAELRGPDAPPVRRLLDIGSGPGVGTCELARLFPDAQVVAVDGSPAMLERATRRAAAHGLDRRITTHLAELPDGLDGLDVADVIWASMSLHHIGDETNALRVLRDLLEPPGLLAVAEVAEPMRVLPDDLDVGRPGLADRLDRAECSWLAAMRAGLSGSVPSTDLASMLTSAGLDVVGSRLARERFDPPLSDTARQVVLERIRRVRQQLDELLDDEDLHTLDMLSDADDPRSVVRRPDVFLAASRQIVVARPRQDP